MNSSEIKQLDFRAFVDNIKEKTSLSLSVFSEHGLCLAGDDFSVSFENVKNDIIFDKSKNLFIFSFTQLGKIYYGVVPAKEDKKDVVALIKELSRYSIVNKSEMTTVDFLSSVMHGEMTYSETTRYAEAFFISELPCGVLIITLESGKVDDVISALEGYVDKNDAIIKLSSREIAIIRFISSKEEIEHSFNEFADFILQFIYEETGVRSKVYIGGVVKKVYDLSQSFSQAVSTERICNSLSVKGSKHNYKEYVIFKMLEELPKYKLTEYLDSLVDYIDNDIFSDNEMTNTAEEFLENNLNISETSRKMFLHRNTLTYRLDKIERETGLDVRKFSDAITFRLITLIKTLLK